jgi:serine O-acetyltransferase
LRHFGRKGKRIESTPVIGDNVYIATDTKILGNVRIGNNVVIGTNSVVLQDVYDGKTIGDIPAKEIQN